MLKYGKLLITGIVLFASTALTAQDVFRSSGVSTRSYNYFEVQYLTDVDVDNPYLVTLLVDLNDKFSFTAEYIRLSESAPFDFGGTLKLTVDRTAVGFAYHRPFTRIEGTDWVGMLLYGETRAKASALGESASATRSFQEAYLGLRKTLSDQLEGEIGARLTRGDSTEYTADIRVVYRLARSIDIAFGVREITEANLTGIGLRYTW